MRKRHVVLALATAVGLAVTVVSTASAEGADPASRPEPSPYLALGDSVAAGVGAQPPAERGYVPVLYTSLTGARHCGKGQALGCRLDLTNLAVPGATTSTLLGDQLPAAERILQERNQNARPVDDVRLITIDIGGNDIFRPIVTACADPASPTCVGTIQTQLQRAATNYEAILSRLRAAAGPDTVIAVMTYYNPLPACNLAPLAGLADMVLEGGGPVPAGLNDIIRSTAAAHDAVVAETEPVIENADLVGGADCLHPNTAGHQDIAGVFADVIDAEAVIGPPGYVAA
jgi:lysophospholipase L1-like esterase